MTRTSLMILVATGTAHAAEPAMPQLAPHGTMPSRHVAHMYFNIATGEKIATLMDATRPANDGISPAVWIADNILPCAVFGQNSRMSGVIDDPFCTTCFSSTATGQVFLDWGDITADTVIDCVGVTWGSWVQDTDTNSDGIGDGVPGFGATWTWFDGDNGFDSAATRKPIVSLTLIDLPGKTGTFDQYLASTYTATIDLATSFTSSLVFEIGDTDSVDGAGTGNYNPGAGQDLDSDGYADFSYSMRYYQPGTTDFDGDGVPDGDAVNQEIATWQLVTGNGGIALDGSYIPEDSVPGAIGIEDAFDVFTDTDGDGVLDPIGTFFYGGFQCVGPTGNRAFAQFYMKLYGPSVCGCCPADVFPVGGSDGLINFFDLAQFVAWFNAGDLRSDVFPPASPDGTLDFFDISTYLSLFAAGCP